MLCRVNTRIAGDGVRSRRPEGPATAGAAPVARIARVAARDDVRECRLAGAVERRSRGQAKPASATTACDASRTRPAARPASERGSSRFHGHAARRARHGARGTLRSARLSSSRAGSSRGPTMLWCDEVRVQVAEADGRDDQVAFGDLRMDRAGARSRPRCPGRRPCLMSSPKTALASARAVNSSCHDTRTQVRVRRGDRPGLQRTRDVVRAPVLVVLARRQPTVPPNACCTSAALDAVARTTRQRSTGAGDRSAPPPSASGRRRWRREPQTRPARWSRRRRHRLRRPGSGRHRTGHGQGTGGHRRSHAWTLQPPRMPRDRAAR